MISIPVAEKQTETKTRVKKGPTSEGECRKGGARNIFVKGLGAFVAALDAFFGHVFDA